MSNRRRFLPTYHYEDVSAVEPHCEDSAGKPLRDYKIYGSSVQDGVPAPEAPVEIKSVGDYDAETGKYRVPVTVGGKNLFKGDVVNLGIGSQTGDTLTLLENSAYKSIYIEVKEGATYSISRSKVSSSRFRYAFTSEVPVARVVCIDNEVIISYDNSLSINNVTAPIGAKYMVVYLTNSDEDISDTKYQIEESTQATTYEPYFEPKTYNIYLDEPLRGLGDYADYVDFRNGTVVRNVEKKYLSELDISSNPFDYYSARMTNVADWNTCCVSPYYRGKALGYNTSLCSHFENVGNANAFTAGKASHGLYSDHPSVTRLYLDIGSSEDEAVVDGTVENVGSLYTNDRTLKDNWELYDDVYFVTALAAPTETSITLPAIETVKNRTNIISAGTAVEPSKVDVQYYKK